MAVQTGDFYWLFKDGRAGSDRLARLYRFGSSIGINTTPVKCIATISNIFISSHEIDHFLHTYLQYMDKI